MPTTFELQVNVAAVGEGASVRLVGFIELHVSPVGTMSTSWTVPVSPLTAVTLIVDAEEVPAFVTSGPLAEMVKSWTAKLTDAWRVNPSPVPVTVAEYDPPEENVQDRVELPDP